MLSIPLKYARLLLTLLLLLLASASPAAAQSIAGGQGNAAAQPFEAAVPVATSFVNDARTATAATATAAEAQLTVSDFQSAGFNAEDAQKIVAGLGAVGSASTDIAVVAMTAATTAPPVTESTTAPPVTESTTPPTTTPTAAATTVESVTLAPAVTEASTLAPQSVMESTTQVPALTAAPVATAEAERSTTAPTTNTATAFSANVAAGDSSKENNNGDGVGAVTLLAGGVGCVLAIAVIATALRRKLVRPKTPGTPPQSRAAYFHCEKRLTPPMEMA